MRKLMDKLLEDEGCLRGVVTCCLSCQLGCWASCHNPLVVPSGNMSGDRSGELPAGCEVRPGATLSDWRSYLFLGIGCRIKKRVGIVMCMYGSMKGVEVNKIAYWYLPWLSTSIKMM